MRKFLFILNATMILLAPQCFATLGESSSSVKIDQQVLHSINYKIMGNHQQYTVIHLFLKPDTTVQEYVSKSGLIFAVCWQGHFKPNLRQLLGKYFATMVSASTKRPHISRTRFYLNNPELVIESTSHMRFFTGKAYLPKEIPDGLNASDIHD